MNRGVIFFLASAFLMIALFTTELKSITSVLLTISFMICLLYFDMIFKYYTKLLIKKKPPHTTNF